MESSEPIVQDRLWRASQGYRFLKWRRRQTRLKRVWKVAKKVGETVFVALVVLGFATLALFLLFGVGNPLP
jgi:hypothetical protein